MARFRVGDKVSYKKRVVNPGLGIDRQETYHSTIKRVERKQGGMLYHLSNGDTTALPKHDNIITNRMFT